MTTQLAYAQLRWRQCGMFNAMLNRVQKVETEASS
jgi:hypothetical protein